MTEKLLTPTQITAILGITNKVGGAQIVKALETLRLPFNVNIHGTKTWDRRVILDNEEKIIEAALDPYSIQPVGLPVQIDTDALKDELRMDFDARMVSLISDELEEVREIVPKLLLGNQEMFKVINLIRQEQVRFDTANSTTGAGFLARFDQIDKAIRSVTERLQEMSVKVAYIEERERKMSETAKMMFGEPEPEKQMSKAEAIKTLDTLPEPQSKAAPVEAKKQNAAPKADTGKSIKPNEGIRGPNIVRREGVGDDTRTVCKGGKDGTKPAHVAIIGIVSPQREAIEKEFSGCFKLTLLAPDQVKECGVLGGYDEVFAVRGRATSRHLNMLRSGGFQRRPVEVSVSTTKIRDALTAFFVRYSDEQKKAA